MTRSGFTPPLTFAIALAMSSLAPAQEPCTTHDFDPPNGVTLLDPANPLLERPKRASLTSDDLQIEPINGSRNNSHPDVSSDGDRVAWVTSTTRVVSGFRNANNHNQIYVRDLAQGTTSIVSIASNGSQVGSGDSNFPRIADDHRIFFQSNASDLVVTDVNALGDVFEYDVDTGSMLLLSKRVTDSVQGNGTSTGAAPSDTGRFVTFVSEATNLVSFIPGLVQQGQTPSHPYMDCPNQSIPAVTDQVFLLDRGSGFDTNDPVPQWMYGPAIAWLSVGRDANGNCEEPHDFIDPVAGTVDATDGRGLESVASDLSASGCRVVFESTANNLIAGMNVTHRQIYLWERDTQQVSLVSHAPGDATTPGNRDSLDPAISDDGRWVVFRSLARNLQVPQDDDDNAEIFVVDLDVRPFVATKINVGVGATPVVTSYDSSNGEGFRGPCISPNGRWISLSCNIDEYLTLPGEPPNGNTIDTLIHDRDADGDGVWSDPVSRYLHLMDPALSGPLPYGNGLTVPFVRFSRVVGAPGSQSQVLVSTTTSDNLDQNQSPPDTNGTLPSCTSENCGDDIYVRTIWEE